MARYHLKADHWPLVTATLPDGLDDSDYDAMFEQWGRMFARRAPFAALTDARAVKSLPTAKQRARIGAWTKEVDALVTRYSLGHMTVLSNTLVRGALTAIEWIHKTSSPRGYKATLLEGYDWCADLFVAKGVPISNEMRELRLKLVRNPDTLT